MKCGRSETLVRFCVFIYEKLQVLQVQLNFMIFVRTFLEKLAGERAKVNVLYFLVSLSHNTRGATKKKKNMQFETNNLQDVACDEIR